MSKNSGYLTDPLALAVLFHVTYEKLAPQNGYETRTDTRVFDPASKNGQLMLATCAEVQKVLKESLQEILREERQRQEVLTKMFPRVEGS